MNDPHDIRKAEIEDAMIAKAEMKTQRLEIFTIALDALPFIAHHLPVFEHLNIPWHWTIAEGAAANIHCTNWCQPQDARLSRDGSSEYLDQISRHPCVTVLRKHLWQGKVEMVNACVAQIKEPSILIQCDSDEIWESWQLESIFDMLSKSAANCARFKCKYFVGPNIVCTGENCWSNQPKEWLRAWKFTPGQRYSSHEPPVLMGVNEPGKEFCIGKQRTEEGGMTFFHYAYYLQSQVEMKERFYGYKGATEAWKRLQANTVWPIRRLADWLPWTGEGVGADLLFK